MIKFSAETTDPLFSYWKKINDVVLKDVDKEVWKKYGTMDYSIQFQINSVSRECVEIQRLTFNMNLLKKSGLFLN